jgi:hypothetical protein
MSDKYQPAGTAFNASSGSDNADAGPLFKRLADMGDGTYAEAVRADTRFFSVAGTVLTRPANATPYTANDSVSNNATAGSVTALSFTVSDVNDGPVTLEEMMLTTADTGVASKSFRAWIYNSDPTASSGVQAGDNAAFSNKRAGFVGTMSGTWRAMQDGSVVRMVPDEGSRIIANPSTGGKTFWYQLQTLSDFTPSANSTTFTPSLRGFQGRA